MSALGDLVTTVASLAENMRPETIPSFGVRKMVRQPQNLRSSRQSLDVSGVENGTRIVSNGTLARRETTGDRRTRVDRSYLIHHTSVTFGAAHVTSS